MTQEQPQTLTERLAGTAAAAAAITPPVPAGPTGKAPRTHRRPTSGRGGAGQQMNGDHDRRPVDVVLHDLSVLARRTATDQKDQAQVARRRGEIRTADLHRLAAGVHEHYALTLGQLAANLQAGVVLRTEPTLEQLLAADMPLGAPHPEDLLGPDGDDDPDTTGVHS